MARSLKPDLILMDIVMTGEIDGISAASKIKEEYNTAIIFVSGFVNRWFLEKIKRLKPVAYILKPFQDEQIQAAIEIALHNIELEGALQASEEKYRHLVEASNAAVFSINADGEFLYLNSVAARDAGGNPEDFVNRTLWDVFPYDLAERHVMSVREIIASGQSMERETQVDLEGVIRWYYIKGQPVRDDTGNVYAAKFVASEITEQKLTEKALWESETKSRIIMGSFPDLMFIYSREGIYLDYHASAEALVCFAPEKLLHKSVREVLPEGVAEQYLTNIERSLDTRQQQVLEYSLIVQNGLRHFEARMNPIDDQRVLCIVRDVTARMELEQMRLQCQKVESLNLMARTIAHNFNNMLSIVMGNLELVMGSWAGPAEILEHLHEAMEGARRASEMSAFMQVYAGRQKSRMELCDLNGIAGETLAELKAVMPPNICLSFEFSSSSEMLVNADVQMVREALIQLATNARESIGSGVGEIRISTRVITGREFSAKCVWPPDWNPDDGLFWVVEVADTGMGIPSEFMGRVTDPFFSTKFAGRGMGLSFVLGVAQTHGGAITIESTLNSGSTVRVFFPIPEQHTMSGREADIASLLPGHAGLRVFLVEDDDMVGNVIDAMLRKLGFEVVRARDGAEALTVFPGIQGDINLVITDLVMPKMNGWQTIAGLRKIRPGVDIILTSGYDEPSAMSSQCTERPQAFLQKPFRMTTLKETIENVLSVKLPGIL